jgi:hypothetical protein
VRRPTWPNNSQRTDLQSVCKRKKPVGLPRAFGMFFESLIDDSNYLLQPQPDADGAATAAPHPQPLDGAETGADAPQPHPPETAPLDIVPPTMLPLVDAHGLNV